MKKMDIPMTAKMIMLRGIGFKQAEISERLGVAPATISYQLRRLRKLAEDHNPNELFAYYIKGLELQGSNKEPT